MGCKLCCFLISELAKESRLDIYYRIEQRLSILNVNKEACLGCSDVASGEVLLSLSFPGMKNIYIVLRSHILPATAKLWQKHSNPFDIGKILLHQCSESHERCRNKREYDQPTRLLSIGKNTIKLVATADLKSAPPYATLSYYWGTKPFMKLTQENLEVFLQDIRFEDLAETFKGPVHTARKIRLEYIWIDALCIIQDQDDDWLKESGRMRSVYGGAQVNIAASSARGVHEGIFQEQYWHKAGFCARVTTSDFCQVRTFYSSEVYEDSAVKHCLTTRAWCFQERLLAPRTMYFGYSGMFWECRSEIKSSHMPDEIPISFAKPWEQYFPQSGEAREFRRLIRPDDKAWTWREIIEFYSRASLTYSSDKLPALSGIAERQQQVTGDQYLAGMWRKKLINQLLWFVDAWNWKEKKPKWRAPSWSWTSVDGIVQHLGTSTFVHVHHSHVLDAWTRPSGPDPYGEVTAGELSLACPGLVRARHRVLPKSQECGLSLAIFENSAGDSLFSRDCLEDEFFRPNEPLYMCFLFTLWPAGQCGLVVQRCGDKETCFRRVGSFGQGNRFTCAPDQHMEEIGESTAEALCARVLSDAELAAFKARVMLEWEGEMKEERERRGQDWERGWESRQEAEWESHPPRYVITIM